MGCLSKLLRSVIPGGSPVPNVNDTRQIHILRVQRATSQNASYHGELQQKVCHVMRAIVFAIVSNRSQMIPTVHQQASPCAEKKLIEKTNYIIKHLRCFMTQVENVHWKFMCIYIIHINLCFSWASFQGDRSQVTQLLPWSSPCVGRAGCSIHQQASKHCIEGGDRQTPSSESSKSKYFQHFLTYHWYHPSSSSC